MHYNVITRQENSGPDASYFLRKIKAENISYLPGKFLHFIAEKIKILKLSKNIKLNFFEGMYDDSPLRSKSTADYFKEAELPRKVIEQLYSFYFMDFLLFNYTIDEFL